MVILASLERVLMDKDVGILVGGLKILSADGVTATSMMIVQIVFGRLYVTPRGC
jgi:hypothetical protein